jgi:hypothetical protein
MGSRAHARYLVAALLALGAGAALVGCGLRGQLAGDVYRDGAVAFRIGRLPPAWRRVQVADGELAFHHAAGGAILAHATCRPRGDAPLDVLTNHLLFGFEDRQELARDDLPLDGRKALRTRLTARLDGVPVVLDLVVLKKDGCVYDLELTSSPAAFAERQADFERFFLAFARVES